MQQFALSASFLQRAGLTVFFAVILSSFLAWPSYSSLIYHIIQTLLFIVVMLIFVFEWRRLSHWRCLFSLGNKRAGTLLYGTGVQASNISLSKKAFICPLVCIIFLQVSKSGDQRLLLVWSDMLDDTAYRDLCRLLLSHQ
jgi:toxin CptA